MKKVFIISILAFLSQFSFASNAQAGWVEFFFPSLRQEEADPTETLQAPFADEEMQAKNQIAKGQLPENSISLEKAHRDVATIRDWLVTSVSEAMTFDTNNFAAELDDHRQYFDQTGAQEYEAFLTDKGIQKVLDSNRYYIRNFVEDVPLILNEGAVSGSYRWLFEVPVTLSYMDKNMTDYKESEPINQKVVFTIQVGRSATVENQEGILIEHWAGKLKK